MKKLSLLVGALLACFVQVNAQDFVSTTPSNRNVIIEEFTGRNCGYCPDGHVIANEIVHNNPGRVWSVNVHAGGFSPTSYPNLNTTESNTILNGFGVSGFPSGAVNRSDYTALNRGQWASYASQQMGQVAECNVAGQAVVNPATRVAKITVEVYYTGNSAEANNYLTVMMLQDSIWGSQSGGSYNPEQYVNGQYCHMHILRSTVTPTWGEQIAPTTAGTLITKEYMYEIPETIGTPNGVEVDLDNITFLAFVTESVKTPGNATRPILNACELSTLQGTEEAIYPYVANVSSASGISCSETRTFNIGVTNGGLDEITSLKLEAYVDGELATEQPWEGSIASYAGTIVEMDINVPGGTHDVEIKIVEANGAAFEFVKEVSVSFDEWVNVPIEGEEEEFTIEIMQDKYGNQITWELIGSDGTALSSGGPYTMLVGGSAATQLHQATVTIPNGECVKFVIKDAVGNGICCQYGEGYYQIKNAAGDIIVDGDGDFGTEAAILLSVGAGDAVQENIATETYNVFPNPVKDVLTVKGENMSQVVIYNSIGQLVETINTNDNEVKVNVSAYQNGMYFINVIDNNGEMTTTKVSVLH
ncbi:MAG: Omp28-related outer membrane protein [Bacteroidales bacterium]|nr:Omp28-related outer membrane protein [Bacteroidales bacterium]